MKQLWAPWRIEYIKLEKPKECIFCKAVKENKDKENLILWRGKDAFVIMNRFPYNNGHLMIAPYRHIGQFEELTKDELAEMSVLLQKSIIVLRKAMSPEGFNVGINIGKIAGAGVEDHIHMHIVPRWSGDTNFMPVISDTRVIPQALHDTYTELKNFIDVFRDK